MIQAKAARWFQWIGWLLKKTAQMTVKTVRETHSWIIFNCIKLKGPPLILEPILFAGTIAEYSKKATAQDDRMIRIKGQLSLMCISESLSWPYQAIVIKTLDTISRRMVHKPCMFIIPKFRPRIY